MAHEMSDTNRQFWIAAGLSLFAALAFYFSTNATLHDLDYTSEIASALLHGDLGLREKPPDWLIVGFCWPCFQFLEPGRGAILDSAALGKSLSVSLCSEKPQPFIFVWSGRLLS